MSLYCSFLSSVFLYLFFFFFFNDPAPTEIYTTLPYTTLFRSRRRAAARRRRTSPRPATPAPPRRPARAAPTRRPDRKSTRLNSSHSQNSYAVICLKKKNTNNNDVVP